MLQINGIIYEIKFKVVFVIFEYLVYKMDQEDIEYIFKGCRLIKEERVE